MFHSGVLNFIASGQISVFMTEVDAENTLGQRCYHIVYNNEGNKFISFASQKYRYYDTDGVLLDERSISSMLSIQYAKMKLVQHHFDVDVSGFGVLPYDLTVQDKNCG